MCVTLWCVKGYATECAQVLSRAANYVIENEDAATLKVCTLVCVCVCVCARARARACVRVWVCVCV